LTTIKKELLSDRAVQLFVDYLPSAMGSRGKDLARRYVKMLYGYISQNAALQQCSVASLIRAASQAASLDLEIDARGLAYLVPYKNKGTMEAQFQIGYLGLMELAYRSEKVKSITANCIYESERDKVTIRRVNGRYVVQHPFSFEPPKGKIIAAYATAEIEGLGPQTVVLRADEIERFRRLSKAPNSPAWTNFYPQMAMKTAIRQLAKFLPKSVMSDLSRAAAMDEQADLADAAQEAVTAVNEESGAEAVDPFPAEAEQPSPKRRRRKKVEAKTTEDEQGAAPTTGEPSEEAAATEPYICGKCDARFAEPKMTGPKNDVRTCPECGSLQVYEAAQ